MAHTYLSLAPPTKNNDFPLEGRRHFMNLVKASGKPRRWFSEMSTVNWQWLVSLEPKRKHGTLILPRRDQTRTSTDTGAHLIRSISEIFRAWISHYCNYVISVFHRPGFLWFTTFCRKSLLWPWHFVLSHLYGWHWDGYDIHSIELT